MEKLEEFDEGDADYDFLVPADYTVPKKSPVAKAREIVRDGAEKAKLVVTDGANKVKEVAGQTADRVKPLAEKSMYKAHEVKESSAKIRDKAASAGQDAARRAADKTHKAREQAVEYIDQVKGDAVTYLHVHALDIGDPLLVSVMEIAKRKLVLSMTADPQMPSVVRSTISRSVEAAWPDIVEEVRVDAHALVRPSVRPDDGDAPGCLARPRAWVLHKWLPHDKGLWTKLRDPFWWVLMVFSITPVYNIAVLFWLLLFVLLDKGDEYQLINVVIRFKSSQFLSAGVLAVLTGAIQYYQCVNFSEGSEHDCFNEGPGVMEDFWVVLASFSAQQLVIWTAFGFLPFSMKKGNRYFRYQSKEEVRFDEWHREQARCKCCCSGRSRFDDSDDDDDPELMLAWGESGSVQQKFRRRFTVGRRRLMFLLVYDIFCFLGAMAILLGTVVIKYDTTWAGLAFLEIINDWKFRADVFWCRTVWAILGLPFWFISIPPFTRLLTHARSTGYTKNGHCVREVPATRAPVPEGQTEADTVIKLD